MTIKSVAIHLTREGLGLQSGVDTELATIDLSIIVEKDSAKPILIILFSDCKSNVPSILFYREEKGFIFLLLSMMFGLICFTLCVFYFSVHCDSPINF